MSNLLLIAHGSATIPDAGKALMAHAESLEGQHGFGVVRAGFLNGAPSVEEALASLPAGPCRMLPFFMGEGYFTKVVVPRRIKAAAMADGRHDAIIFLPPLGLSPRFAGYLEDRALQSATEHGLEPARTCLMLAGHGNSKSPDSSKALRTHASSLAQRATFAAVDVGFLEEEPFLIEAIRLNNQRDILLLGVFAGEGTHVVDDMPAIVAEAHREGHKLVDAGSIGSDAAMPALIAAIVADGP